MLSVSIECIYSFSEPNLISSSASEPEVTSKPSPAMQTQEKSKGEELKKSTSGDSVMFNIHLTLPGVAQPIDVVVSADITTRMTPAQISCFIPADIA